MNAFQTREVKREDKKEAHPAAENRRALASLRPALRHLLREPLLHFVVLGGLLFVIYGYVHRGFSNPSSHKIQLTAEDLNQLEVYFVSQWHREPTGPEFASLIEDRVRDEVLYREALGMGLDKNDVIVKRRMAQKMEFLSEDIANAHEPATAELKAWYSKNAQRFMQPDQVTFRHLYFSSDRRGQSAQDDATAALAKLGAQPDASQASELADPFPLEGAYEARTLDELAKDFGLPFAQALFKLKPGSWQGPIQSGYGWHLVFVKSMTLGRVPPFEEVEPDVKAAWFTEQRSQQWRTVYAAMRAKYEIVLPATIPADASRVAAAPPRPTVVPSEAGEVR
jgi:peptidyl-prolyl cis-trans isomerase C